MKFRARGPHRPLMQRTSFLCNWPRVNRIEAAFARVCSMFAPIQVRREC